MIEIKISATEYQRAGCLRYIQYRGIDNLELTSNIKKPAIAYGLAFHKAMEEFEYTQDTLKALTVAQKLLEESSPEPDENTNEKEFRNILHLSNTIVDYFKTYKGQLLKPLYLNDTPLVEIKFKIPYRETSDYVVYLCGTIDKVVRLATGDVFICDYKTSSTWNVEEFLSHYALSYQLLFYELCFQLHFPGLATNCGYLVDGVFVQKSKPTRFKRSQIFYPSESDRLSFKKQLDEKLDRIIATNQLDLINQPDFTVCKSDFFCPFFQVCAAGDENTKKDLLHYSYKKNERYV